MALKLKYTDEHGILHINMSPSSSPTVDDKPDCRSESDKTDINDPKFDTINHRFGQYDLFGGKYENGASFDEKGGDVEMHSLFRSRYNSIEEELANTPYAFATERTLRFNAHSPLLDITIERGTDVSPSKDIEDDRFFHRPIDSLFGPSLDFQKSSDEEKDLLDTPAFTVTQLIHAQDRYFDLSSRQSTQVSSGDRVKSASEVRTVATGAKRVTEVKSGVKRETEVKPGVKEVTPRGTKVNSGVKEVKLRGTEVKSGVKELRPRGTEVKSGVKGGKQGVKEDNEAFRVLSAQSVKAVQVDSPADIPVVPISVRKKEKSFTILAETPSRPESPRSLPSEVRLGRVSPFRGRGFREETSRHTTPRTSTANSRANTPPPRRRTSSLTRLDSMAAATLPPPLPPMQITLPHTPRDFVKENIEEVRELSELNREKHEAEAEIKRLEEEEALLKEMGLLDQNAKSDAIRSVVCSRTTSRSNSPNKIRLRSRSNSPSAPSILRFENLQPDKKMIINKNDGMDTPVTHRSRVRSVSKSQPQSNDGSPKHSKIPKRQSSVSPNRKREPISRRPVENGLRNQRFISNSTSSINETIKIGSQAHDRRGMSKSTQFLNIAPAHIRGKPPISPGRGGPPPSNRAINPKRLSPIVGTPNKSPTEDKPNSARTPSKPSSVARKPVKTAGNTPATSRFNSRQPSRNVSRDPSPEKRRTATKPSTVKPPAVNKFRPVARAVSTRTTQKPVVNKTEPKKPVSRTNSMKSLTRTLSMTKNLAEKPPAPLKKRDSQKSLKGSTNKLISSAAFNKPEAAKEKSPTKSAKNEVVAEKSKETNEKGKDDGKKCKESSTEDSPSVTVNTTDSETQYDKITNEKGDLVILTKKNIVSMTTAAITSQPLEVVTKVTNQLPSTLEKAREKGIFERHSSRDSLGPKEDDKEQSKSDTTKKDDKTDQKGSKTSTVFAEDNVKLKPLLPPYNNPQVERVKQRIDDILKSPEVSTENIAAAAVKVKDKEKSTFKNLADKTKSDIKDAKDDTTKKFTDIKDQAVKQSVEAVAKMVAAEKAAVDKIEAEKDKVEKAIEKTTTDIRTEASKIVDSIMTPIEDPKPPVKPKDEVKKDIEPIVTVVNEKTNGPSKRENIVEKMQETLVKGEPEVEVQSSNMSTPGMEKMALQNNMADGSGSDKSAQSNGGFPQSTSTTPKPPARTKKEAKEPKDDSKPQKDDLEKPQNICQRIMGKCKKCCACCVTGEEEKEMEDKKEIMEGKGGMMSRLNCCKKKDVEDRDAEMAAGKAASIEFESEVKRKRKLRDVMCGWCGRCGRGRRVSDVSQDARDVTSDVIDPADAAGCCGRRKVERRDSILSDRPPNSCCNNRLTTWLRGCCRRQQPEPLSASRRQSLFSKNKSMSPTLPPEMYVNTKYHQNGASRWRTYGFYRLLLIVFMLNEISVCFAVGEIAHSAFFIHAFIHLLTIIFVGTPLMLSEICIAQYTNCSVISFWNYFPLFRGFGYAMILSNVLRTIYLNILSSWYLVYTFYSALEHQPWNNCEYFGEKLFKHCMVKRINVSTFQHCLERAEAGHDSAYYTASYFFFEETVGDNNSYRFPSTCFYQWKSLIACACINFAIFVLMIKKEKFLEVAVKVAMYYTGFVIFTLICVSLFEEGSWEIAKLDFAWEDQDMSRYIDAIKKAFLTSGPGTGMVAYLSRDVEFRSPATMTAILSSLLGVAVCLSMALVLFSGIKCMIYYHGGEERVIEQGKSIIFAELGSVSEILSYFDSHSVWAVIWFSAIFYCLFMNIWLSYSYIFELIMKRFEGADKHCNFARFIVQMTVCTISLPFFCSDLFEALVQASFLLQLFTSFFFSISLYWFYGYEKHSIDITFMIGIKSSLFWKISWIMNPIMVLLSIYSKLINMHCRNYSHHLDGTEDDFDAMTAYWVLIYVIVALYVCVIIIGTVFEVMAYRLLSFRDLTTATESFRPKDITLYKSRRVFVPSIMTTEFLYRQVKIRGYTNRKMGHLKKEMKQEKRVSEDSTSERMEWSALTSN